MPNDEISFELTIKAIDEAHIEKAFLSSWYGPSRDLISNE